MESEIYDLSFALRKLTVMKCQMRKWRMERLQLESENRSLKQALQSFGIDVPLYSRTTLLVASYAISRLIRSSHDERRLSCIVSLGSNYRLKIFY